MKRFLLSSIFAIAMLVSMLSLSALANQDITVYLDNEIVQFDVMPKIVNGRTMVPMRAIFEKLGAEVMWDDDTHTAYAIDDANRKGVTITIGKNYMLDYFMREIPLDVPAVVENGRTLIPLRAVSEAFGCDVYWDENSNTVIIFSEKFIDFTKSTGVQEEITVSTPEQLLNSIGSNKKIILTSDYYNLSEAINIDNEYVEKRENMYNEQNTDLVIKNVVNMTIEGNAEIVIDDINSDVLSFEKCGNITLSGLTVGHTTYYDEYACEGAVTRFNICDGIYINNCNLFGCGAIGINAKSVKNLLVTDSKIYECSFTGMYLSDTTASVKNTEFSDSTHWGGFVMLEGTVAEFDNCSIHDIIADNEGAFAFIDISDYLYSAQTKVIFNNCSFYNNSYADITNSLTNEIEFNNCSINDNTVV